VATPDGHRAPIAGQLLRVRSINTQTPSGVGGASAVIGRRWRDVTVESSPQSVTLSATTALPVVPFNDASDDDSASSDDESALGSGESE